MSVLLLALHLAVAAPAGSEAAKPSLLAISSSIALMVRQTSFTGKGDDRTLGMIRTEVERLCRKFPLYPDRHA